MKTFELYGREWPINTPRVVIELYGFKQYGKTPGFLSRYEHAVNAFQLLWPQYPISVTFPEEPYYIERGLNGLTVENTFLLTALKALCEHDEVGITGSASSGKSFIASAYNLMCFYARPTSFLGMLSTTSGLALDQRIWSEVKKLHNSCTFPVGNILNYLRALIFDPSRAFNDEKDASIRDMRDGLIGIAIPNDAQGDGALQTIVGRKNEEVRWTIDEMAYMPDNVLGPCGNLESGNPRFQLIVLANAKSQNDAHGRFSEPKNGWPEEFTDMVWETKTGGVCVHLDGLKSPNLFPGHERIDDVQKLPFPRLINHFGLKKIAIREGGGDEELGRKSAGYWMMGRGIWIPSAMDATVLSSSIVRHTGADKPIRWGYGNKVRIAAADPSFTLGGDKFSLILGTLGNDEESGEMVLVPDPEPILITPEVGSPGELYDQLAAKVVRILHANGVQPGNFGMDVSHDGGVMAQSIIKLWGTTDIHLISSLGTPTDRMVSDQFTIPAKERYDRQVTEYWYSVRVGMQLGRIKGFNLTAPYARDLFERRYSFKPGGKVGVETKSDMKERLGRSPDHGDSFSYLVEVARRAGLEMTRIGIPSPRAPQSLPYDPITLKAKGASEHPAYKQKHDTGWKRFQTKIRSLAGVRR